MGALSDDAVRAVTPTEKDPMSRTGWRAGRRVVLGLVVGLAVGLGASWWLDGPSHTEPSPSAERQHGDRSRLLAAWRRSASATYTLEGVFRRTTEERGPVDDPLVVVQRGTDRIALGYGSWDGVVDGRGVHCLRSGRSGPFQGCEVGEPVDRDEEVRAELDRL